MFGTTDTSDAVASALKRPYDPAESDVDTADIHVPSPGTPPAVPVPPGFVGPSMNAGDQAAAEANDVSLQKLRAAARLDTAANIKAFQGTSDLPTPPPSVPNNLSDVAGVQSTKPDASQLPSLYPQGPKNGILHTLLRATGFVGDDPKPGELYDGPTTTGQKINAGMGFAGRIGNALAAAAGTPQQQEVAEKRSEFGPELKQKGDLARATLDSLSDYRQGRVQNAADQVGINQQKADQTNQVALGRLEALGEVPDPTSPSGFRRKTTEEIGQDPMLQADLQGKQLLAAARQADTNFKNVQTQTALTGDTAAGRLAAQKAQAQIDALRNAILSRQVQLRQGEVRLGQSQGHLDLARWQSTQNFGGNDLDPQALNNPGMASPSAMVDGQPTPLKSPLFPTAQIKNIQAQANVASEGIPVTIQEINRLGDKLGPLSGRWNDFMQGKVGMDDPDFAGLRSDLLMVSSAVALAHARGRLPENLREEFDHMINAPQQTPENIVSILTHIQPWMERAAQTHVPQPASAGGGAANAPASGAGASAPTGGSKLYLFPDGKKRPVAPNMVREAIADGAQEAK